MVEKNSESVLDRELLNVSKAYALRINLRTQTKEEMTETVALDAPINLYVNMQHVSTIIATPDKLKELGVGFLMDEGVLLSKEEIDKLLIDGYDINMKTRDDVKPHLRSFQIARTITTSCGSVEALLRLLEAEEKLKVESKITVPSQIIPQIIMELGRRSTMYRVTGGTHAAGVFYRDGRLISFAEDVGRHSAVDKAIGEAILYNTSLSECILASTGRLSVEMVLKAVRVGIPIVASIAAPIYSGVYSAEVTGITLIGFVRGLRMNVYTHPYRIVSSS